MFSPSLLWLSVKILNWGKLFDPSKDPGVLLFLDFAYRSLVMFLIANSNPCDCCAILEVAWHCAQRRTIKLTCIISIAFWSSSERACIERQSQRLSILRVSTHKLVSYCAGARLRIRHRHRPFAGRSNYLYQAVNCPELSFPLVTEIKHLQTVRRTITSHLAGPKGVEIEGAATTTVFGPFVIALFVWVSFSHACRSRKNIVRGFAREILVPACNAFLARFSVLCVLFLI